jgi:hypothetical protein
MNKCNHFEYILTTLTVIITTNVLDRRLSTSLYWRRLQLTNKPNLNSNHHSVFITYYVEILVVFWRLVTKITDWRSATDSVLLLVWFVEVTRCSEEHFTKLTEWRLEMDSVLLILTRKDFFRCSEEHVTKLTAWRSAMDSPTRTTLCLSNPR